MSSSPQRQKRAPRTAPSASSTGSPSASNTGPVLRSPQRGSFLRKSVTHSATCQAGSQPHQRSPCRYGFRRTVRSPTVSATAPNCQRRKKPRAPPDKRAGEACRHFLALKAQRPDLSVGPCDIPGNFLRSHTLARAVPSGLRGLTSVFGMGTGGSPSLRSPRSVITYSAIGHQLDVTNKLIADS
jgi:hypothetical protein